MACPAGRSLRGRWRELERELETADEDSREELQALIHELRDRYQALVAELRERRRPSTERRALLRLTRSARRLTVSSWSAGRPTPRQTTSRP